MEYTYDIKSSKLDKRSTLCLWLSHSIKQVVNLFVSTFLIAYIYSFSGNIYNYIMHAAVFELAKYGFMLLMLIPLGFWVDKTNRIGIYRLGIVLQTAVVIVSIFLGKDISKLTILAGAINGVADAFYYSSYNTLKQEMVSRKIINNFGVVERLSTLAISVIIPIFMGALIDVSAYSQVAIYVLVICVIWLAISFGVKAKKPKGSSFSLKDYFKKLKENPAVFKRLKAVYLGQTIYGFTTIVSTILNICIMMQFGTNLSLGALTSVFAVVSMLTILLINKFSRVGKRPKFLILSALLPIVGAIVFVVHPSWWTLVFYNLLIAIIGYYKPIYDLHRHSQFKEQGLYNEITEHQIFCEILLEISRVFSYVLLILISLFRSLLVFKIFLCISVLSFSIYFIYLHFFERKFCKQVDETQKDAKEEK